ncbi:MAG: flagellin FliC [Gammaproteobacteria bacterium]|nr:flagellin FliC [Gammaproteobacteria bacterium]
MANVVNTNIGSINTQRALAGTQGDLKTAMERLSSGLRINSAKDDAAGLAISERLKAQSSGMEVAARNAADGISFAQTAEGALIEVGEMLQRMRDLAVQSANGTNHASDRDNLQDEFGELAQEIERTIQTTAFNGLSMFDGGMNIRLHVGPNTDPGQTIELNTTDMKTTVADVMLALNIGSQTTGGASLTPAAMQSNINLAIDSLDVAIDSVTTERSTLGASMNRLEHTISNLRNSIENTEASKSRITDADFAKESAALSRSQVLQQAASSMLAQANQSPQAVLSLIK